MMQARAKLNIDADSQSDRTTDNLHRSFIRGVGDQTSKYCHISFPLIHADFLVLKGLDLFL